MTNIDEDIDEMQCNIEGRCQACGYLGYDKGHSQIHYLSCPIYLTWEGEYHVFMYAGKHHGLVKIWTDDSHR